MMKPWETPRTLRELGLVFLVLGACKADGESTMTPDDPSNSGGMGGTAVVSLMGSGGNTGRGGATSQTGNGGATSTPTVINGADGGTVDAPAKPSTSGPRDTTTDALFSLPVSDSGSGRRDMGPISTGTSVGGCAGDAGLVCDDFEAYDPTKSIPKTAWRTNLSNATLKLDGIRAFSGKQSVHILTNLEDPKGGAFRMADLQKSGAPLFPMAGNAFYGRMMMWLDAMPQGGVHWNNVHGSGKIPNSDRNASYAYGGMFAKLMAGYGQSNADGQTADCSKSAKVGLPEKKWFCFEWHFDGANDKAEMWIDGKAMTDVSINKKGSGCVTGKDGGDGLWHAPLFSSVTVGWQNYQLSSIPIETFLDDVAIDTNRVGCPPGPASIP